MNNENVRKKLYRYQNSKKEEAKKRNKREKTLVSVSMLRSLTTLMCVCLELFFVSSVFGFRFLLIRFTFARERIIVDTKAGCI